MNHWIQYVGYAITPVLTITLMRLLGKTQSLKVLGEKPILTEEENRQLKSLKTQSFFFILGGMLGGGIILFILFRAIGRLYHHIFLNYEIILPFPEVAYAIPALFLGMLLATIPMERYFKKLYGISTYERLTLHQSHEYKVNSEALTRAMIKWMTPICLLFFVHSVPIASYVSGNKLIVRNFASLSSTEHELSDIKEIVKAKSTRAPNGNIVYRESYFVIFKNGTQWEISNDEKTDYLFADALAKKVGLQYTEKDFYQ